MTKVSKKYAYKGVDFDVQNVLKLTSTFISKNFSSRGTPGPR